MGVYPHTEDPYEVHHRRRRAPAQQQWQYATPPPAGGTAMRAVSALLAMVVIAMAVFAGLVYSGAVDMPEAVTRLVVDTAPPAASGNDSPVAPASAVTVLGKSFSYTGMAAIGGAVVVSVVLAWQVFVSARKTVGGGVARARAMGPEYIAVIVALALALATRYTQGKGLMSEIAWWIVLATVAYFLFVTMTRGVTGAPGQALGWLQAQWDERSEASAKAVKEEAQVADTEFHAFHDALFPGWRPVTANDPEGEQALLEFKEAVDHHLGIKRGEKSGIRSYDRFVSGDGTPVGLKEMLEGYTMLGHKKNGTSTLGGFGPEGVEEVDLLKKLVSPRALVDALKENTTARSISPGVIRWFNNGIGLRLVPTLEMVRKRVVTSV